jgi:hypothetical protein
VRRRVGGGEELKSGKRVVELRHEKVGRRWDRIRTGTGMEQEWFMRGRGMGEA